jgi:hypothetical protein
MTQMLLVVELLLLTLALPRSAMAPAPYVRLQVTALFADGAVLQTADGNGPGARITGTAAPGEVVTLTGLPSTSTPSVPVATADGNGDWEMKFNATSSSNGLTLTLTGASPRSGSIVATDVLIGEVYLCSGQVCTTHRDCDCAHAVSLLFYHDVSLPIVSFCCVCSHS